MYHAALNGDINMVQFLFEHGADIQSALDPALVKEHIDVVKYAINNGASLECLSL